MFKFNNYYDIFDIDPFGSCLPYIDSTIKNIRKNGMIALTTTDLKILEGRYFNLFKIWKKILHFKILYFIINILINKLFL